MPLICSLCTAVFDDLGDSCISYVVSSAQNGLLRNTEKKIETEVFCITVSLCAYTKIVAVEELVLLRLDCGAGEGLAGTGGREDVDGVSESPLVGGAREC